MSDLTVFTPQQRISANAALIKAVQPIVLASHVISMQGKQYLQVSGQQVIASAVGYTTKCIDLAHFAPSEGMPGYWQATCVVVDGDRVIGQGFGSVFDDERPWCTRPQFARQMMAQTRATGRALKGVLGWANAMIGVESSLHEEMPYEQDAPTPKAIEQKQPERKPAKSKGTGVEVRGICGGVETCTSKAGKQYWRVTLEVDERETTYTSFKPVADLTGEAISIQLEPYRDGYVIADIWAEVAG